MGGGNGPAGLGLTGSLISNPIIIILTMILRVHINNVVMKV